MKNVRVHGVPVFPVVLIVVAVGMVVFNIARDGFWWGALSVFLLWWAINDRNKTDERERYENAVADYAPELIGKNFVETSTYILDAIAKFKHTANQAAQTLFHGELEKQQREWTVRGEPMPPWATLRLLRRIELDSINDELSNIEAEKQQLIDEAAEKGKTVSTDNVLRYVEELKATYKDSNPEQYAEIDRFITAFRQKYGGDMPVDEAYKILREFEGKPTRP